MLCRWASICSAALRQSVKPIVPSFSNTKLDLTINLYNMASKKPGTLLALSIYMGELETHARVNKGSVVILVILHRLELVESVDRKIEILFAWK